MMKARRGRFSVSPLGAVLAGVTQPGLLLVPWVFTTKIGGDGLPVLEHFPTRQNIEMRSGVQEVRMFVSGIAMNNSSAERRSKAMRVCLENSLPYLVTRWLLVRKQAVPYRVLPRIVCHNSLPILLPALQEQLINITQR